MVRRDVLHLLGKQRRILLLRGEMEVRGFARRSEGIERGMERGRGAGGEMEARGPARRAVGIERGIEGGIERGRQGGYVGPLAHLLARVLGAVLFMDDFKEGVGDLLDDAVGVVAVRADGRAFALLNDLWVGRSRGGNEG